MMHTRRFNNLGYGRIRYRGRAKRAIINAASRVSVIFQSHPRRVDSVLRCDKVIASPTDN